MPDAVSRTIPPAPISPGPKAGLAAPIDSSAAHATHMRPGTLGRGSILIPFCCSRSGSGADVLVHTEQILRIVLRLEARQPLVVGPVGTDAHALLLVLGHEVHVHPAGRVRRQ